MKALKIQIDGSPVSDMTRFKKNFEITDDSEKGGLNIEIDQYEQMQSLIEGLFHLGEIGEALTV
jgi:hypothetical protein